MTCLDNQVWKQAQLACNARLQQAASVKGFGYAATGVAGLRGLGLAITGSIDPSSIIGLGPSPSASAPSVTANPIAVAPNQNDPCAIANQLPCGGPDSCPTGQKHFCERLPRQALNGKWGLSATICSCLPLAAAAPPAVPGGAVVPGVVAGGFSHWGLLAALAVGGGALYLVMRKKS